MFSAKKNKYAKIAVPFTVSKVPMFVNAFSKDDYSWRPKTRITFFGLGGTAPKVISRFVRVATKLTTTFFLMYEYNVILCIFDFYSNYQL